MKDSLPSGATVDDNDKVAKPVQPEQLVRDIGVDTGPSQDVPTRSESKAANQTNNHQLVSWMTLRNYARALTAYIICSEDDVKLQHIIDQDSYGAANNDLTLIIPGAGRSSDEDVSNVDKIIFEELGNMLPESPSTSKDAKTCTKLDDDAARCMIFNKNKVDQNSKELEEIDSIILSVLHRKNLCVGLNRTFLAKRRSMLDGVPKMETIPENELFRAFTTDITETTFQMKLKDIKKKT